jgi:hypothetical protein
MIPDVAVIVTGPAFVPVAVTTPAADTVAIMGSLGSHTTPGGVDELPSEKLPAAASANDAPYGSGGNTAVSGSPCAVTLTLCSTGVPTPSVIVCDTPFTVAVIVPVT